MDLSLSLTHDCNLNCSYCYAGEKCRTSMTQDIAEKALDFAFSFGHPDMQLGFFGGEPLMEWELLKASTLTAEAMAERTGTDLKKTLTTNATLLTGERSKWLKEHDFYVALSIDGNRNMHDITRPFINGKSSFDHCMRGLDDALAMFQHLEVIVVPDPDNVAHMTDSVRFLVEEKGVLRISINPNFYAKWNDESLKRWEHSFVDLGEYYLEQYREGRVFGLNFIDSKVITGLKNGYECGDRCNFGEKEIAVAPSGRLYPCERLIGEDTGHAMSIGDVFNGFDESKRARVLKKRGNVNMECIGCEFRPRCMNWCCCINYALTGAIDETDGIVCFHERTAIQVADRVGALLFEERNPAFLKRFYYEDAAN